MKLLVSICFVISFLCTYAQDEYSYETLVSSTNEVSLNDSLHIDSISWEIKLMDSSVVRKWFAGLLPNAINNRLKNRNYYLAGKITSHNNFDLLLVLEEKKRADSNTVQVVYFVTFRKDGTYISSLEAAVSGNRKKSSYNTSSWLYKDYKIVKDSRMVINQKNYDDVASYKISGSGRFILYSN
jgi:hypothetical protein